MVALVTPKTTKQRIAPDFKLKNIDGKFYSLKDLALENGLVVMFICNHCPYVKAIIEKIISDMSELKNYKIGSVAIMSNDTTQYEEDSFTNMQKIAAKYNFPFPYLFDETQEVARAYDAVCTPDFFGFNGKLEEQYRGRLDDSQMKNNLNNERELFNAMVQVAKTGIVTNEIKPSIGCSIKWKQPEHII